MKTEKPPSNAPTQVTQYRKFRHYDWKSSYEALRDLGLKHPLVLDVGCGDGRKTIVHMDIIEFLIGLDMDLKHLKEAKMRGIYVVRGDATKLPFKNDSFDAILSFHVIEPRFLSRYCDSLMTILKK